MAIARREFLAAMAATTGALLTGCAGTAVSPSSRVRTIDAHAHWTPREWVDLIVREGARNNAKVGVSAKGQVSFSSEGMGYVFPIEQIDLDIRLKAMDAARVDVHALSLTTPMVYWAPAAFGLKLSQVYNDACSAAYLKYPTRFVGMATLPMQAPDLAVEELERASKLPGMRGAYMSCSINGKNLDEKIFFPVYAKCEELGWPIFLHPSTIVNDRMPRWDLRNFLGNPYETGIAAASLMFGGVMDTFPKLDVMLPHAGGTFPALVGRMDHGADVRPEVKHMTKHPLTYQRRFYYDTIAHNNKLLTYMIRDIGADRFMIGSDYPADMGYERPVDVVEQLTEIPPRDRDMILGGNAARLLKI